MLKGKINQKGHLFILREKDYKKQECPFISYSEGEFGPALCGDWCPQFGEPVVAVTYDKQNIFKIVICEDKELIFDEFIDERSTK